MMDGIVVASSADMATICVFCSRADSTKFRPIHRCPDRNSETGAFEHHRHKVFADIVRVTFDRTVDDPSRRFDVGFLERRFEQPAYIKLALPKPPQTMNPFLFICVSLTEFV